MIYMHIDLLVTNVYNLKKYTNMVAYSVILIIIAVTLDL